MRTSPGAVLVVAAFLAASAAAVGAQAQSRPPGLEQLTAWERRDLGVPPPPGLHRGAFHGPTPNRIPGGQVITTQGLVALLQRRDMAVHLVHVLDWGETLPFAVVMPWASAPGTFDDPTQRRLGRVLDQATGGDREAPLVFYCASAECWMSYNAALRAIRLGHRNVLWYRGGLEAWSVAGLGTFRPGGGLAGAGGSAPAQGAPAAGPALAMQGGSAAAPAPGPRPPGGGGRRPPGALPPDAFGPEPGAPPRR